MAMITVEQNKELWKLARDWADTSYERAVAVLTPVTAEVELQAARDAHEKAKNAFDAALNEMTNWLREPVR